MNDFDDDLKFSHSCEDMPCWEEIYRAAFPSMSAMVNHRQDGDHQRMGIDRTVILANSKIIKIDEKARREDYGDIALEFLSNDKKKTPGWMEKELLCDYIAYAIIPSGIAYLLPVLQLQSAWRKNKADWLDRAADPRQPKFKICKARNYGYTTHSLAMPVDLLFAAIGANLRVKFTPVLPGKQAAPPKPPKEQICIQRPLFPFEEIAA
jgi:hypothetical protein